MFAQEKKQLLDDNQECELRTSIVEYLADKNCTKSADTVADEFTQLGLSFHETQSRVLSASVFAQRRAELTKAFESNDYEAFFQNWTTLFDDKETNNANILKLEFQLRLHFALAPLRGLSNNPSEQGATYQKSLFQFTEFLEGKGASLSQTPDLVRYFALEYIQQPRSHALFKELFEEKWIKCLREKLIKQIEDRALAVGEPVLVRLYKSAISPPNESQLKAESTKDSDLVKKCAQIQQQNLYLEKKVASFNKQFRQTQSDYKQLACITNDLIDAVEQTINGKPITVEYLTEINKRLADTGSTGNASNVNPPDPKPTVTEKDKQVKVIKDEAPAVSKPSPPIAKSLKPTVNLLDYNKVRNALDNKRFGDRNVAFLLQGLRWMVTKTEREVRVNFVQNYIIQDILGSEDNYRKRGPLHLFEANMSSEVKECAARFVNMLASLKSGRRYLSRGFQLLTSLANLCKKDQNPTSSVILKHSLAALQKLSLRRSIQNALIRLGLIDWLVKVLPTYQKMDDYVLEYSVALLMNLSLRTAGKYRCADRPKQLLNILKQLLLNGSTELYPYINGTFYSILTLQAVRKCALEMKMQKVLEDMLKKTTHIGLKKQLPYVLKQLKGDAAETDGNNSSDDEQDADEEDEEEDSIETELDDADTLKPRGSELAGEQLLRTKYALNMEDEKANFAAKKIPAAPDRIQKQPSTDSISSDKSKGENRPPVQNGSVPKDSSAPNVVRNGIASTTFTKADAKDKVPTIIKPPTTRRPSDQLKPVNNTTTVINKSSLSTKTSPPQAKPPDPKPAQSQDECPINEEAKLLSHPDGTAPVSERVGGMRVPNDANTNEYTATFGSRPKVPRTPNVDSLRMRNPAGNY